MSVVPTIVALTDIAAPSNRPVATVTAPNVEALVEASAAAVEQGFYVRVLTDGAMGETDPIALFAVLAAGGVAEVETSFVRQAQRCGAMQRAISNGQQ